ncbi:hypothetical protein PENTCL1PPCAC_301, partial [Pristionchus entomophagus]
AHHVQEVVRAEVGEGLKRVRRTPRWLRILRTVYHDYGLKHVMLILLLVLYQFLGAAVFYYTEAGFDEDKERNWNEEIAENRTLFVSQLVPLMFNNSDLLFYITPDQGQRVAGNLTLYISRYEKQLGIKYTDQKIKWDFWNAMLYAQTICTTIGYGHLYPSTNFGRGFTMIYAIFGIPLVLSILDDLGKLLTRALKTPWWLIKCGCRRAFKYCTKQTIEEIRRLDEEDKKDLEIFDLPVPIAIFVVMAWIFICSATFCIWEHEWDYFLAFYFFFISLSTIGLGDITPTQPKYLLMLFIYIIIGLSLVSMCINLIQAKLERTYEAGATRMQHPSIDRPGGIYLEGGGHGKERIVQRRGSSLGVFRTSSSAHSLNKETVQAALANKKKSNRSTQTVLSFPSPTATNANLCRSVSRSKLRLIPRTLSIDDVMRMVDTTDGDILVLSELVREESGISAFSTGTEDSEGPPVVLSKSFDIFAPAREMRPEEPAIAKEAIEEMEDAMALGHSSHALSGVHFRSRLSLIPEQQSTIDEGGDTSDTTQSQTSPLGDYASPPNKRREPYRRGLLGLLRRKPDKVDERMPDLPQRPTVPP